MDKKRLNSRDYAFIAERLILDVNFKKLEFESMNPDHDSLESEKNWRSLKLLYDIISQFIDDEPLPF